MCRWFCRFLDRACRWRVNIHVLDRYYFSTLCFSTKGQSVRLGGGEETIMRANLMPKPNKFSNHHYRCEDRRWRSFLKLINQIQHRVPLNPLIIGTNPMKLQLDDHHCSLLLLTMRAPGYDPNSLCPLGGSIEYFDVDALQPWSSLVTLNLKWTSQFISPRKTNLEHEEEQRNRCFFFKLIGLVQGCPTSLR